MDFSLVPKKELVKAFVFYVLFGAEYLKNEEKIIGIAMYTDDILIDYSIKYRFDRIIYQYIDIYYNDELLKIQC